MAEPASFQTILGLRFYTGDLPGLLRLTRQGGLIVVPSAPVLADLAADPAHRAALEGSDFAITDSGLMVWLWRIRTGERLPRISGLKYLRALLGDPEFRAPGATFWVMPSAPDAVANRTWLQEQGVGVTEKDCYVAPLYPGGPLEDFTLLALVEAHRPKFVVLCLGGGVQERLGFFLREKLPVFGLEDRKGGGRRTEIRGRRTEDGDQRAEGGGRSDVSPEGRKTGRPEIPDHRLSGLPALRPSGPPASNRPPAILCTGAAIAFLSGRQASIPVWADRLMLGWLLRTLHSPVKFFPRYRKALKLIPLLLRQGARALPDRRD